MLTILILFHSNTFRNFKHYYLYFVQVHLKEEFPELLSCTRFVERIPSLSIPLLVFLKLGLMGECTGFTFIDSTRIPVCEMKRAHCNRVFKDYAQKGVRWEGTMALSCIYYVMRVENSLFFPQKSKYRWPQPAGFQLSNEALVWQSLCR